ELVSSLLSRSAIARRAIASLWATRRVPGRAQILMPQSRWIPELHYLISDWAVRLSAVAAPHEDGRPPRFGRRLPAVQSGCLRLQARSPHGGQLCESARALPRKYVPQECLG